MKKFRKVICAAVVSGLLAVPALVRAELPVEIDVELLSARMTVEEAKDILRGDLKASETALESRDGQKALEVLDKLAAEGVPVGKAYEVVSEAVKEGGNVEEAASERNIGRLKREAAAEEVADEAETRGRKAEDVAAAVEVLDGLIAEGIPVEKARDVVKEAISEDRSAEELRSMLAGERIERARERAREAKPDTDAMGERQRQRERGKMDEGIRDRIERGRPDIGR